MIAEYLHNPKKCYMGWFLQIAIVDFFTDHVLQPLFR